MTETTTTVKPTMTDVVKSLTGYDEIAIAKEFGHDFEVILNKPLVLGRALIFVEKRRDGLTDKDAKKAAMNMRLGDVDDYFAEEEDDDEDVDTPAGEGDSQPV